jgi:HEAT repeat protein
MMVLGILLAGLTTVSGAGIDEFIGMVKSEDAQVRNQARDQVALQVGPAALEALLDVYGADQPAPRRTAGECIEKIAHHAFRPGAADQRQAAVNGLVSFLEATPAKPDFARLKALRMLSLGGDSGQIPLLAAILIEPSNPAVQDAARRCLERIGGQEAATALFDALPDLEEPVAIGAIQSMARLEPREDFGDKLVEFGRSQSIPMRVAICETMAAWGDNRALRLIADTQVRSKRDAAVIMALDAAKLQILKQIDRIPLRQGAITQMVRNRAVADHIRIQGIDTLIELKPPYLTDTLITLLGDSSAVIADYAADRLQNLEEVDLDEKLAARFEDASNHGKAAILGLLAERGSDAYQPLLQQALDEGDAILYTMAVDLAELPHTNKLDVQRLQLATRNGDLPVQILAAGTLIDIAGDLASQVDNNQPVWMLKNVLNMAPTVEIRARALETLGSIGHPEGIALVEPFLSDPDVGRQASQAYVQLARRLAEGDNREEGISMLAFIVAGSPYADLVEQAVADLQALGEDTSEFAAQAGFLTDWWLLGPFPATGEPQGLDFPEGPVKIQELYQVAGRPRRWQPVTSRRVPAIFNLAARFSPNENVTAYAYCELEFQNETDAVLKLGSDDGIVAWLNGKLVHSNPASRSLQVDQDEVPVHFQKGVNAVLLKIIQGGVDWAFCARLTAPDGSPLPADSFAVKK